jgi:cytochrome oxidase Cu insertion factor (SCO1/SenC/PrrC family)
VTTSHLVGPGALLGLVLAAAACGVPVGATPSATSTVESVASAPADTAAPTASADAAASPATAGAATPVAGGVEPGPSASEGTAPGTGATPAPSVAVEGWRGVVLEDARTGTSFTVADYAGRLVAIEPMAAWCPKCLAQQREARKALEKVGGDGVVYISLGIDPSEKAEDLKAYADDHGFDWTFAVAPKELSRALAAEFGDQVLSPPSVPFILVGADGSVIEQQFGGRGADELAALLTEHLP